MKYATEKDVVGWLKKLKTGTSGGGSSGSGGSGSGGSCSGDMLKSVYDQNNNGIVDNSELIDGRKIYVMNRPPQSDEGNNGDIWIEY
jgi:hypothetical protein